VLFSPIAFENHRDPLLPDGVEHNARLAAYSQAIAEVAATTGVAYVDLFKPSQAMYAAARAPLTLNGAHLTEEGNRQLAEIIASALIGKPVAGHGQAGTAAPRGP
jgi:lysophospholipase L1-like esterase